MTSTPTATTDPHQVRAVDRARQSGIKVALAASFDGGVTVDLEPGDMTRYRLAVVPPYAHHYEAPDGGLVDHGGSFRRTWLLTSVNGRGGPVTVEWDGTPPADDSDRDVVALAGGHPWTAAVIAGFMRGLAEGAPS